MLLDVEVDVVEVLVVGVEELEGVFGGGAAAEVVGGVDGMVLVGGRTTGGVVGAAKNIGLRWCSTEL